MKMTTIKWLTPLLMIWIVVDVLLAGIGVLPVWIAWLGYAAFAVGAISVSLGGMGRGTHGYAWAYVGALAVFGAILLFLTFFKDMEAGTLS